MLIPLAASVRTASLMIPQTIRGRTRPGASGTRTTSKPSSSQKRRAVLTASKSDCSAGANSTSPVVEKGGSRP